ncbi:MAG: 1,4-dihydroxy-2-naphthoyl-CoA synthase, partial [Dehalococcoidia bacterium]|nr:1,4-dihydroxy-2-naphthoyl-CoA synthase [Dehalococcoidia bacterium]
VPPDKLYEEVDQWCQEILDLSPTAIRWVKKRMNHFTDMIYGIDELLAEASYTYHMSEESRQAKEAFREKGRLNFRKFRGLED